MIQAICIVINGENFPYHIVTLNLVGLWQVFMIIVWKFHDPRSKHSQVIIFTDRHTDRQTQRQTKIQEYSLEEKCSKPDLGM